MNWYGFDVKIVGINYSDLLVYDVQYQEISFNYINCLVNCYGEWFFFDGIDFYFGMFFRSEEILLIFGWELFFFDLVLNVRLFNFKVMGYDLIVYDFLDLQVVSMSIEGLDDYGKFMVDKLDKFFSYEVIVIIFQYIKDKSELDNFIIYCKQGNVV